MRFHLFSVLCLIGCTIATSNDLNVLKRAIDSILAAHERLSYAFKSITSYDDPYYKTDELLQKHQVVLDRMLDAIRDIRNGPNVNALETPQVGPIIDKVLPYLESNMMAWVQNKRLVENAGKVRIVRESLMAFSESTRSFGDALISKLPLLVVSSSQGVRDKWVIVVESAIRAYSDQGYSGGGNGGYGNGGYGNSGNGGNGGYGNGGYGNGGNGGNGGYGNGGFGNGANGGNGGYGNGGYGDGGNRNGGGYGDSGYRPKLAAKM